MEKPLRILEIFNDFFGEDRVDMQGFPTYSEVASALPERSSLTAVQILDDRINEIPIDRSFQLSDLVILWYQFFQCT